MFNCNSTQTGTVVTDYNITFCLVFGKPCIIPAHKVQGPLKCVLHNHKGKLPEASTLPMGNSKYRTLYFI